jgi:hypothetical protein
MRGRTLNHAFIILDEAQNTTPEQMKMFLTRIGIGAKAVVTGDVTQIDLRARQKSGLIEARASCCEVRGIAFTEFLAEDVVRHPLVARIVAAYEKHDEKREPRRLSFAALAPRRGRVRAVKGCEPKSPPAGKACNEGFLYRARRNAGRAESCAAGCAPPPGAAEVTVRFVDAGGGARSTRSTAARTTPPTC